MFRLEPCASVACLNGQDDNKSTVETTVLSIKLEGFSPLTFCTSYIILWWWCPVEGKSGALQYGSNMQLTKSWISLSKAYFSNLCCQFLRHPNISYSEVAELSTLHYNTRYTLFKKPWFHLEGCFLLIDGGNFPQWGAVPRLAHRCGRVVCNGTNKRVKQG